MFSTQTKTSNAMASDVGMYRVSHKHAAVGPNPSAQTFQSLRRRDIRQLQDRLGNRAVAQMFRAGAHGPVARNRDDGSSDSVGTNNRAIQTNRGGVTNHGLPDGLKSGIERLSGYSMDDVRVHYNSAKPAELNALAYAQGTEIHLASGQERHLPHEAWHVVQQMQGRVQPTVQLKGEVNLNAEGRLEHEADVMGGRATENQTGVDEGRSLRRISSARYDVVQGVLNKADASFVEQYIVQQLHQMLSQMEAMGIQITPALYQDIFRAVNRVRQHAIEAFSDSWPALQYVNRALQRGISAMMDMQRRKQPVFQHDPAFDLYQWEYLMPMMAHIQSAGVFEHALLSDSSSLAYGGHDHVDEWLSDPDISLMLFRQLHQSTQALLWFSNLMQANRQRRRGDTSFRVEDGLDLLNTVGRLSMMIADLDFLPHWDTRALPHNWTSDEFLETRLFRPGFSPQILDTVKKKLRISRRARHQEDASEKTKDPESNTRTDFPYQLDIPITSAHSARVFNSGALRLEFSNARRILNLVNPGARNEDLSYENIVAYLNYLQGPVLNHDMRTVFQRMGSADSFLRELALLLVGIEGTQNNVMAMHGPMVMDLASQRELTWNQSLFTGSRSPRLEHMPYFVYASDATQKGTNKGSAGPMERQTELMLTGKFSEKDLSTEDSIVTGRNQKKEYETQIKLVQQKKLSERARLIKESLDKMKEQMDREIQDTFGQKPPGKTEGIEWEKQKGSIVKKFKTIAEHIADEELANHPEYILPDAPVFSEPSQEERHSLGYGTFKDVYMARQFELLQLFLNTFFPQLHSLDFGEGTEGVRHFIPFVRRLMEHYMIYRFMGAGEGANGVHNLWSSCRPGIELFLEQRSEKNPQRNQGRLDSRAEFAMRLYLAQLGGQQYHWNNCLIYAIAGAAGIAPTHEDIVTLRTQLGIGAGQMVGAELDFDSAVVGMIMDYFCLSGTVNLFTGDDTTTPTKTISRGAGGVYNIHYANHHFTTL